MQMDVISEFRSPARKKIGLGKEKAHHYILELGGKNSMVMPR